MLELLGSKYVIDHVVAEHNLRMKAEAYRVYTSDALKIISEQVGAEIGVRYSDMLENSTEEEEMTGDEIALDIIERAGLKGKS